MRFGSQVFGFLSACPCALTAARLQDFRGQLLGERVRKDAGEGNAEAEPVGGAGDRRHHFGDGLLSGGLRTVGAVMKSRAKRLKHAIARGRGGRRRRRVFWLSTAWWRRCGIGSVTHNSAFIFQCYSVQRTPE